ncbi:MBL fold metallo-hydrolase [Rugosimonospora acidiphila]|uniref:MBL fold metallo-hydrolase n=1 Tax=Rugosimonospora acidiphila TaxID=556531 RepID=A0ABP9S6G8_9ACTN
MSTVEFWGGLGVIGSSKILIRDGGHRVLLDFGLDIPASTDLFRAPVTERPGRELADRLRVGAAPRIPGVFDPAVTGDPELAATDGNAAMFISHPHIDHVGLAGFVDPTIPVHAHTEAVRLMRALADSGDGLTGAEPAWVALADGQVVRHGDIEIECVPVDHDVPGACGYLIRTSGGTLAYTGDIRFHGRHPERSHDFVTRAAGCDVLVTEGTTLSWPAPDGRPRDENDVAASFVEALTGTAGLVLLAMYPRDVERAAEFMALARDHGRVLVWPVPVARFLRGYGLPDVSSWDTVTLSDIRADPKRYVVHPAPYDFASLLDLPTDDETVFLHANGEPLGPFDPRWTLLTDWLTQLRVPLRTIGCSGHAAPDDLHAMVERIRPRVVFPIHTTEPTRLHPPIGVRRVVARYGVRYGFDGDPRG